jgi:hypothetical protein
MGGNNKYLSGQEKKCVLILINLLVNISLRLLTPFQDSVDFNTYEWKGSIGSFLKTLLFKTANSLNNYTAKHPA